MSANGPCKYFLTLGGKIDSISEFSKPPGQMFFSGHGPPSGTLGWARCPFPTPRCWGRWETGCGFACQPIPSDTRRKRKFGNNGLAHFPLVLDPSHLISYVNSIIKKREDQDLQKYRQKDDSLILENKVEGLYF